MRQQSEEQLPIGRAAFAKAFCADLLTEHRKVVLLCLLTLVVLLFTLFQLRGKFSMGGGADYLEAQRAFSVWSEGEGSNPEAFKSLEKPLASHPELRAKFGTLIAQRLLSLGETKKADRYISACLKRTRALTSAYYSRFADNTLAIAHGKYGAALEEAKRLKADLEKDDAFWQERDRLVKSGTVLYAYNLVRIAALERQMGSKEGELRAWEELVQNAGWKGQPVNGKMYDPEAYALLAQNFSQGDVSLLDYIEQRKKELMK